MADMDIDDDEIKLTPFRLNEKFDAKPVDNNDPALKREINQTETLSNSFTLSAFLFLNSMIGSGILNQPFVFYKSGIVGAFLIYIPAAYFTWLGLNLLTLSCVSTNKLSFEEVTLYAFGRWGYYAVNIMLVMYLFGSELSYFLLLSQLLSPLLVRWGCNNVACNQYISTLFAVIIVIFPLSLWRYLGHMGWLSVLTSLSLFPFPSVALVFLLLFRCTAYLQSPHVRV